MTVNASSVHPGYDVLVLGAGIVGTSTALHLQQRGQSVCLVDWQIPGAGTSFGNAGLIERASVVPYSFPQSPLALLRYAANRQTDVHFQWRALPAMAGWLWRYWRESAPGPLEHAAQDMLPLIERCVTEHDALIQAAGLQHLVRAAGWIDIYREPAAFAAAAADARALASRYGLQADVLAGAALAAREPAFLPQAQMAGGIHWQDPWTVRAPGQLVQGYAELFCRRGGALVHTDARSLRPHQDGGWQLPTPNGVLHAAQAVIALGPDAPELYRSLGYELPLAHKRGYHLHFQTGPDTPPPEHPLCDSRAGFVIAPMEQGVRLTTGVELALPDAPPNRIQLERAERIVRQYWPLGQAIEAEPWMGRRPCTPDMRPIISAAPRHQGLWFNFGHAHHGLTLGPASGRLLAEMMTGEQPFTNPAPYSAHRFL
ncbi:NAD(P)/FAD-dependent oxidoreductase [Kerstersia similis]|uniref:NAD(P)/FAD-dependent oxidoreductase n=1 Tax=Kerstersia similis TaxID=206505 RepID=UPI0039EEED18